MDWNVSWIIFGGFAFFLGIANLICLLCGREKTSIYFVFGSLSCGMISVFQEIKMINQWILYGKFHLVSGNIGRIQTMLFWGIMALIVLNFIDVVLLRISRRN
ncbi:MAG: hypothetical protein Q4F17_04595 [Eubacteriales bacterium]|nr:hypothetical protein [Eubacteriales bacterium]